MISKLDTKVEVSLAIQHAHLLERVRQLLNKDHFPDVPLVKART